MEFVVMISLIAIIPKGGKEVKKNGWFCLVDPAPGKVALEDLHIDPTGD